MRIFERGFLTLFKVRNIPVRAHWTVPLVCLMFSGGRLEPGMWVGILLLIFLHELGHAFIVNRVGLVNLGIDLTGFGGLCRWTGHPTQVQRSLVAWGGVMAQTVLLILTLIPLLLFGRPSHWFLAELVAAFTEANLFLIGLNLLPFRPLDGAEAWPLVGHLYRNWKARRRWKKKTQPRKGPGGKQEDSPLEETLQEALRKAERRNLN